MVLKILRRLSMRKMFLKTFIFFYGRESENFYRALEFIGLSPMNRKFGAFFMLDLGRGVMVENKLSIHIESGDVFL